jgi:hypothetical protein
MTSEYANVQKDRLTVIYLPSKAQCLNPNESNENQYMKSDISENIFYSNIEEQKDPVSEYLNIVFEMCYNHFDT